MINRSLFPVQYNKNCQTTEEEILRERDMNGDKGGIGVCGLGKRREGGWRDVVHKYINFYFQFWIIIVTIPM